MHLKGFSLLELIFSLAIISIIIPTFSALFYIQIAIKNSNLDTLKEREIINDFLTFIDTQDYNKILHLIRNNTPLYVINSEDSDIIFRKFVPYDELNQDNIKSENYIIYIKMINNLFDTATGQTEPYIPLMCTLSKLDSTNNINNTNQSFVTVKIY